jgi:hypothetical protein
LGQVLEGMDWRFCGVCVCMFGGLVLYCSVSYCIVYQIQDPASRVELIVASSYGKWSLVEAMKQRWREERRASKVVRSSLNFLVSKVDETP